MAFETINVQENGKGQFLQLPASLKIEDDKVFLKMINRFIYVISVHNPWQPFFNSLENFSYDFMEVRGQPKEGQIKESLD
jgi:virulence-associated protein VagC